MYFQLEQGWFCWPNWTLLHAVWSLYRGRHWASMKLMSHLFLLQVLLGSLVFLCKKQLVSFIKTEWFYFSCVFLI